MNPYDDDETPAQVWLQLQRQKAAERNFVTPAAPLATGPATIDAVPQWVTQAQPLHVGQAWQPLATAKEATSAVDRAKGLQLRLWPFLVLYGAAGVVVGGGVWLAAASMPLAALAAVLVFAALGVGTYIKLNGQDYAHSGAGVERHRIDTAAYLAQQRMEHEHELRRMALESYLNTVEHYDGRGRS